MSQYLSRIEGSPPKRNAVGSIPIWDAKNFAGNLSKIKGFRRFFIFAQRRKNEKIEDADGRQKRVRNKKETTLAQQKQQAIKVWTAMRIWLLSQTSCPLASLNFPIPLRWLRNEWLRLGHCRPTSTITPKPERPTKHTANPGTAKHFLENIVMS